jgi:hypothetical protein
MVLGRIKQTEWLNLDGKYQTRFVFIMLIFFCESRHNVKQNTEVS